MTQPENKPKPKDYGYWWFELSQGLKTVKWVDNWNFAPSFDPIARVLTPDEVAVKDAEIERLKGELSAASLTNKELISFANLVKYVEEITRQRETLAELVNLLERAHGHVCPMDYAKTHQDIKAALTKAKEIMK